MHLVMITYFSGYHSVVNGSVVKRLRHRPFTAVTRVRFPSESLICQEKTLPNHLDGYPQIDYNST